MATVGHVWPEKKEEEREDIEVRKGARDEKQLLPGVNGWHHFVHRTMRQTSLLWRLLFAKLSSAVDRGHRELVARRSQPRYSLNSRHVATVSVLKTKLKNKAKNTLLNQTPLCTGPKDHIDRQYKNTHIFCILYPKKRKYSNKWTLIGRVAYIRICEVC